MPGGRSWDWRSPGCSLRIAAPTERHGSPRTCGTPGGGSARTPSRRRCVSSGWPLGPQEAQADHPAGPVAGTGPDRPRLATDRLNHKWYRDGTAIGTDEGKLYLDSVLDMGWRRIVGFALGEHHDADLAQAALQMAVAVRGG